MSRAKKAPITFKNPALRWEVLPRSAYSILDEAVLIYRDEKGVDERLVKSNTYFPNSRDDENKEKQKAANKVATRIEQIERAYVESLPRDMKSRWNRNRTQIAINAGATLTFIRLWTLELAAVYFLFGIITVSITHTRDLPTIGYMFLGVLGIYGLATGLQTWLVDDPEKGVNLTKVKL